MISGLSESLLEKCCTGSFGNRLELVEGNVHGGCFMRCSVTENHIYSVMEPQLYFLLFLFVSMHLKVQVLCLGSHSEWDGSALTHCLP